VARTGWTEKEIQGAVEKLHGTGRVRTVSAEPLVLVSGKLFEEVARKLPTSRQISEGKSFVAGIAREDLRASLGKRVRSETFRAALEELARRRNSTRKENS